jgi:DNA-binding helix-hairpin-helix protein with protein kinase domain
MTPYIIIVSVVLTIWIIINWRAPKFRRSLSANTARRASERGRAKMARKRLRVEWDSVQLRIKIATELGDNYIIYDKTPGIYPENFARLQSLGYAIDNGVISWEKKS